MRLGISHELHSLPWREPQSGAHVARAAAFMCFSQAEAGVGCPISMTYSVVPALRKRPELAEEWEPRILSDVYDPRQIAASEKGGSLFGMGMTEKQGGSDVRANTTVGKPINGGGAGAEYEITGHKWFFSAPQCDAFLILAQADGGVSCFLMPRRLPDGELNRFRIQRLKDKLGNRSNASSEIEFDGAWTRLVGEEGAGVRTIIEMVNHTRLDCATGSATGMRAGVAETNHASHRVTFGKVLVEQPLMQNVLANLAVESRRRRSTRCASLAHTTRRSPEMARPRRSSASVTRCSSTGSRSGPRATLSNASRAWAGTAMSRSRGCPVSIERRRSPPFGRARGTSSASTSSGRWSRNRTPSTRSSPRSPRAPGRRASMPTWPT